MDVTTINGFAVIAAGKSVQNKSMRLPDREFGGA
jgi:hypothetical protein